MNLLLNTHALLWFFDGSSNLSQTAHSAIINPKNTNFVSMASFWELAIKTSIGKLDMDFTLEELEELTMENGIELFPIRIPHVLALRTLHFHHKDPFDRMIFAQSLVENMSLVSCDVIFDSYLKETKVKRVW